MSAYAGSSPQALALTAARERPAALGEGRLRACSKPETTAQLGLLPESLPLKSEEPEKAAWNGALPQPASAAC